MATSLASGDRLEFRVWCTDSDQASVNTFIFRVNTVTGVVTDEDAAIALDSVVNAGYKAILNNNARYNGVQCRIYNRLPVPITQSTNANAGAGTAGPTALPRQTCGITTWETDFAGPAHRGRTYWPFPASASDTGDGKPNPTYVADIVSLSDAIQGITVIGAGGGGTAAVVFALRSKTNPVPFTIQSATAHALWATQRRRGDYGRQNRSPIS